MTPHRTCHILLCILVLGSAPGPARADQVRVAVASNFIGTMRAIAAGFQRATGHTLTLSAGSTGQLYAQIVNGAPFAVFLAADQARPQRLEQAGLASERITYARGVLVLWSTDPDCVDRHGNVLQTDLFTRLAIANPRTAPYGAAAMQVLTRLGLDARLAPRLIRGDSITQTYQFVATGNAELGFVARAQLATHPVPGSHWTPPPGLYTPLQQDAVLLRRAEDQPAARVLLGYLRSPDARALIAEHGYAVPPPDAQPQRGPARTADAQTPPPRPRPPRPTGAGR